MSSKIIYGIIIICIGVFLNVLISGTDGLEREEKTAVYAWVAVILLILTRKYYN